MNLPPHTHTPAPTVSFNLCCLYGLRPPQWGVSILPVPTADPTRPDPTLGPLWPAHKFPHRGSRGKENGNGMGWLSKRSRAPFVLYLCSVECGLFFPILSNSTQPEPDPTCHDCRQLDPARRIVGSKLSGSNFGDDCCCRKNVVGCCPG